MSKVTMHLSLVGLNGLAFLLIIETSHASVIVSTASLATTIVGAALAVNDLGTRVQLLSQGCHGNHIVFLVHHFEIVAREKVRNCRELRTVARAVVIELKQRDSKELHVLGDGKNL